MLWNKLLLITNGSCLLMLFTFFFTILKTKCSIFTLEWLLTGNLFTTHTTTTNLTATVSRSSWVYVWEFSQSSRPVNRLLLLISRPPTDSKTKRTERLLDSPSQISTANRHLSNRLILKLTTLHKTPFRIWLTTFLYFSQYTDFIRLFLALIMSFISHHKNLT